MQYDVHVQQHGSSDSMSWVVHIFILHWHILCTAVHASVQHPSSYFVVYAEVASQAGHRQGAAIREGADQRYFTVCVLHGYSIRCMWAVHTDTVLVKWTHQHGTEKWGQPGRNE